MRDRRYCVKWINVFGQFSVNRSFNSFPNKQILDSSKLKKFAGDNFEFGQYGKKFTKRVENTVRKGEIACYE